MISFKSQPLLTGYVRRHIIRNFFKTMLKYKLKPLLLDYPISIF